MSDPRYPYIPSLAYSGIVNIVRFPSMASNCEQNAQWIRSQASAWNENEEEAEGSIHENRDGQNHYSAFGKKLADIRLPDAGEIEGGVFAVANESHDGIQGVLVRGEEIDSDSKW
jgi:hypothetical protein